MIWRRRHGQSSCQVWVVVEEDVGIEIGDMPVLDAIMSDYAFAKPLDQLSANDSATSYFFCYPVPNLGLLFL